MLLASDDLRKAVERLMRTAMLKQHHTARAELNAWGVVFHYNTQTNVLKLTNQGPVWYMTAEFSKGASPDTLFEICQTAIGQNITRESLEGYQLLSDPKHRRFVWLHEGGIVPEAVQRMYQRMVNKKKGVLS